jgi:NADPH:quinone reductase-like Zn-dependent oxidoreductase
MLAAKISNYIQDYNEIELISKSIPELREGHVLVKVLFAAINPLDYKVVFMYL